MDEYGRPKIAVFGSAGGSQLNLLKQVAYEIGKMIALKRGILCSGACPGLPLEAAKGAADSGGMVLGFSPAINLAEHVEKFHFPVEPHVLIFTGMEKKGRNIITVRSSNAAILIAGRWGTMNEFTILWDEADETKVIGLLDGSGGYVENFLIPEIKKTEKPSKAKVVIDSDYSALVNEVFNKLRGD